MNIFINTATMALVRAIGDNSSPDAPVFKRGDGTVLNITFLGPDGLTPMQLPSQASVAPAFCIKAPGAFDSAPLVLCTTWTLPSGAGTTYVMTPNFSTTVLNAIFGVNTTGDSSADIASFLAMGEFSWYYPPSGLPASVSTFQCNMVNDVYRGTESAPTPAVPAYPDSSLIALKAPLNGSYLIDSNGTFRLYDNVTATYKALWFANGVLTHE